MDRSSDGTFETVLDDVPAGTDYCFRLDGERDRPDPVSRHQPHGVHGPSRIVDPRVFDWSDHGWTGIELPDLIFYEIHVGTFTAAGTFESIIERLPELRSLGITALELMPVAEFPGRRNWGYDVAHLYAPHSGYGGPEGLRRLVDAAHGEGLAVFLDVVYNHLGPEGNYLDEFGPYFTERYQTPWGRAINFDGPYSDPVRRHFIENALYWITEYHVDGLRLDAVHAIFDFSARHILEEIARAVHDRGAALGRHAYVIAESDLNDPRLVRDRERGGYGLDAQWSDDLHHAIHAALTGERAGYYVDFGARTEIAKSMQDRFALDGRYSVFRHRRHGAPARDLAAERFVVYMQNHDQVGNRACGDRISSLIAPDACRLAAALVLLSPYIPLVFMGEEYAEARPFLYFVDHGDPELAAAVRRGRRRDFRAFGWADPVPDPSDPATFEASRPDWSRRLRSPHAEMLQLYRDLTELRHQRPVLRPGAAEVRVESDEDAEWMSVTFSRVGRAELLTAYNLTSRAVTARTGVDGVWRRLLSTDDARYGGPGPEAAEEFDGGDGGAGLEIPPLTGVAYGREVG